MLNADHQGYFSERIVCFQNERCWKNMWYAVSLLYKRIHSVPVPTENEIWEESIRLIEAGTWEDALDKAKDIGDNGKPIHIAEPRDGVAWKFVQVESIFEILGEPLTNGSEIFSRFLRDSEVKSILKPIYR
ncbi:MAG: DUF4288 domain-containing protein [Syntrophobacteraceae bacterium]